MSDHAPTQTAKTKPATAPPKLDKLPPYAVILHNDDHNDIVHVVDSILVVTPLKRHDAVDCTMRAHQSGTSLVTIAHLELAELYRDGLRSRGLTVTIEPAN